jgi:hypothetical protein
MGKFRECSEKGDTLPPTDLERAQESLKAAQLCLREGLANSAASRAYYAMFQAAQVAMSVVGSPQNEWSHHGLQAASANELIHYRKVYPAGSIPRLPLFWTSYAACCQLWVDRSEQKNRSTFGS